MALILYLAPRKFLLGLSSITLHPQRIKLPTDMLNIEWEKKVKKMLCEKLESESISFGLLQLQQKSQTF